MICSGVSVTSMRWPSPPTKASTVRSPSRDMLPTRAMLMWVDCPVSTSRAFDPEAHRALLDLLDERRGREGYASARNSRAAATMLASAGRTSSHLRVFRPQSGLTQIWASASRCSRELEQAGHLFDVGHARRVDVVDARADLVRVAIVPERIEQFHLRARGLDRDHVGIHRADRVDDVVELRVAHVGVDLRLVAHAGRAEAESFDRPVEVGLPFATCAAAGLRAAPPRRSG